MIVMDYVPTYDEFIKKAISLSDQECLEYCDEILSHNAHTADALLMKSACFIRLKKFEDAISCCNKIIDLSDEEITNVTYDNKGLALSRLGKFTEALECHKKSFELNDKDKVNFTNTSMALGGLGRHEEAIENCEKALEIDPNRPIRDSYRATRLPGRLAQNQRFHENEEAVCNWNVKRHPNKSKFKSLSSSSINRKFLKSFFSTSGIIL